MDWDKCIAFANNLLSDLKGLEPAKRDAFAEQLNRITARNHDEHLNVALIGDFSSGKSTFINALLGMDVLKVGWLATTAVPTKIYRGSRNSIVVESHAGDKYSLLNAQDKQKLEKKLNVQLPDGLDECINLLSTSNAFAETLKYIELYVGSNALDEGMCIIDTPGVNPGTVGTEGHVDATRNALREHADAAIVLFPAQAGYKHSFEQFLTDNALHFMDNAIFVVTMMDLVDEGERREIVAFVESNLVEQFGIEQPLVFGVSAKQARAGGAQAYWETGFRLMQHEIYEYLKQRRETIIAGQMTRLLTGLLKGLGAAIADSTAKLGADLAVLERNSVEKLEQELLETLQNAERDFRYMRIDAKDGVMNSCDKYFEETKGVIRHRLSLCGDVFGDSYGSIRYYCSNSLKNDLEDFQRKTSAAVEEAIGKASSVVARFYETANSIPRNYRMGLGEISREAGGDLPDAIAFDSSEVYREYIANKNTKLADAALAALALAALLPAAALAALDEILKTDMLGGIERTVNKLGNWAAKMAGQLQVQGKRLVDIEVAGKKIGDPVENARNNAYDSICRRLDESYASNKKLLNDQLTDSLNSMLHDMGNALTVYKEQYRELFAKKRREYDAEMTAAKELIEINEMNARDIKSYLDALNGV